MSAETFAAELRNAEARLRAAGLSGRAAYAALCRELARRLGLPREHWIEGPDAPASAGLERIALTAELDLFGLAYERFFPEIFKAERGQFFTPRPVALLMADLVGLRPGERVLDPTCGSGGFLVIAAGRGADVDGIEIDPELAALCRLNLKMHGQNPRSVRRGDLFRAHLGQGWPVGETWDVILANPPFSVEIRDPEALAGFELARGKSRVSSDVLFIEAAWRLLRSAGRMAVLLPHSILANPTHARLREWMAERFVRRAIISLPEGVFRPFGGAACRACIVVLDKRPAEVRPWRCAVVTNPGYDPARRVYRRTEPDELAGLRLALRDDALPTAPADAPSWLPQSFERAHGIGPGVPRQPLGGLVTVKPSAARPEPGEAVTEIDLADVDKLTGEVRAARVRWGEELKGGKTAFSDGDLLFARMRPNLNNVAMASRPDPALPERLCGSSEWVRLDPGVRPWFSLIAARSSFVRNQLTATGGQTRPRVQASDLPGVEVPMPGVEAQALIDRVVGVAHAQRRAARQRLDAASALYERFGRGEIDEAALLVALRALP